MKYRPILFSGPMVRAILEGRKTQTRRVMKPQPVANEYKPGKHWWSCNKVQMMVDVEDELQNSAEWEGFCADMCPYGKIGDRLWVRETWQGYRQTSYEYDEWESMNSPKDRHDYKFSPVYRADQKNSPDRWLPAIHMPREFSRITLEITDIRVERLNDIREADAKAEGIMEYKGPLRWVRYLDAVTGEANFNCARDAFVSLWESINGAGSWAANPWVWVIEFKRVAT